MGRVYPFQAGTSSFDRFWALYPTRVKRKEAKLLWAKLAPEVQEKIIERLPELVRHWRSLGWYNAPHPTTFLRQERWDDEIPQQQQKCSWPGCKFIVQAKYCQGHQEAVTRGETPVRR